MKRALELGNGRNKCYCSLCHGERDYGSILYTSLLTLSVTGTNWVKMHKQSVEHVFSGTSGIYKHNRVVAKGITDPKIWELLEAFGFVQSKEHFFSWGQGCSVSFPFPYFQSIHALKCYFFILTDCVGACRPWNIKAHKGLLVEISLKSLYLHKVLQNPKTVLWDEGGLQSSMTSWLAVLWGQPKAAEKYRLSLP